MSLGSRGRAARLRLKTLKSATRELSERKELHFHLDDPDGAMVYPGRANWASLKPGLEVSFLTLDRSASRTDPRDGTYTSPSPRLEENDLPDGGAFRADLPGLPWTESRPFSNNTRVPYFNQSAYAGGHRLHFVEPMTICSSLSRLRKPDARSS